MSDSRYSNPYLLRENIDWTDLANGYVLAWSEAQGRFEFVAQGVSSGDPGLVGTKEVDETGIGDGKILEYSTSSGKLEYVAPPSGATAPPLLVPLAHSTTLAPNGQLVSACLFTMDASDWVGKTVEWFSTCWAVGGHTVTVKLLNLTDGETCDWQSVASAVPATGYCQLTVGTGTGNLKTASKIYEVTVTASANDTAILGSTYLRISDPA